MGIRTKSLVVGGLVLALLFSSRAAMEQQVNQRPAAQQPSNPSPIPDRSNEHSNAPPKDLIPPASTSPFPPGMTQKQRADLLKYNFKQMKKDADELASLAQSLQSEIEKSNANVLSLDVVKKAKKIEKLAKKIQNTARGY